MNNFDEDLMDSYESFPIYDKTLNPPLPVLQPIDKNCYFVINNFTLPLPELPSNLKDLCCRPSYVYCQLDKRREFIRTQKRLAIINHNGTLFEAYQKRTFHPVRFLQNINESTNIDKHIEKYVNNV